MRKQPLGRDGGGDTRARVDSRLVQNRRRQDGRPGNYYLRIRVEPAESLSKSLRVDVPLETNERAEARARAAYVVRTILRLGRRVMGDLAVYLQQAEPCMSKRRRKRKAQHQQAGENRQLMLF